VRWHGGGNQALIIQDESRRHTQKLTTTAKNAHNRGNTHKCTPQTKGLHTTKRPRTNVTPICQRVKRQEGGETTGRRERFQEWTSNEGRLQMRRQRKANGALPFPLRVLLTATQRAAVRAPLPHHQADSKAQTKSQHALEHAIAEGRQNTQQHRLTEDCASVNRDATGEAGKLGEAYCGSCRNDDTRSDTILAMGRGGPLWGDVVIRMLSPAPPERLCRIA
jgi:hypothetical protein